MSLWPLYELDYVYCVLQFMVMSFKMKKLLIYEKEDDMETGGPITTYDFRYITSLYRRSTIFHCHLIFVGRGKNKKKIYNTIQNSGTIFFPFLSAAKFILCAH